MYLIQKIDKAKMFEPFFQQESKMFGVQIPPEADRCEIWGTTFHDPEPDCCEYRFFHNDTQIGVKRVAGY